MGLPLPESRRSTYGTGPHTDDHDTIHDVINVITQTGTPGQVLAKSSSANSESFVGAKLTYISVPNASDFLPVIGGTMLGNLSMNNQRIVSLGTPTATTDATNKQYVDQLVSTTTANMAKYVTASTASTARPVWAGPVVWTVIYSPFSAPTNAIDGDHVIDASGS